jgi:hypothetical protein
MNEPQENNMSGRFLALTFTLSWLFWIPAAILGSDFQSSAWGIPFVLGGFGPSAAAVILVFRHRGREERRDFWKRVIDFKRISWAWYLFLFLIFPAVMALSFLISTLLGNPLPAFETLQRIADTPLSLIGTILIGILTGPLSEELGWRGYVLDQLRPQRSLLASSLIVAPFWWAWHLPLFFMEGTSQQSYGINSAFFWLFAAQIIPLSVIFTWAAEKNRRSILAAVLGHFTFNFVFGLVYPVSETVYFIQVIVLFLIAGGMVLIDAPGNSGKEIWKRVLPI